MMGLVNILKTPGMSSHGIISRLRRLTGIKKIGHAGTLDPQAAGVLPVCIGSATKMIPYMPHRTKTYRVEMKLGVVTDTQDMTGKVVATSNTIPPAHEVKLALAQFQGVYWQVPPMYSAIKQRGKKLYELARCGKEVHRPPRRKTIQEIRWISMMNDLVMFDVICSEGTYVRTLCHDVGQLLGCGASMAFLLRLESCGLTIEESFTIEELEAEGGWKSKVMPVDLALSHYPGVEVPKAGWKKILNGMPVHEYHFQTRAEHSTGIGDQIPVELMVRVYLSGAGLINEFIGMGAVNRAVGQLVIKKRLPLPDATSF